MNKLNMHICKIQRGNWAKKYKYSINKKNIRYTCTSKDKVSMTFLRIYLNMTKQIKDMTKK